jgi:hypothetical protein
MFNHLAKTRALRADCWSCSSFIYFPIPLRRGCGDRILDSSSPRDRMEARASFHEIPKSFFATAYPIVSQRTRAARTARCFLKKRREIRYGGVGMIRLAIENRIVGRSR